jgi:AraC-like DNA-binding protein
MVFNIFNVIMLLAAIQGFLLAFLIWHKYGKIFSNRFLVALIATYSVVLSYLLLGDLGFNDRYPIIIPFLVGGGFLIPVFHYLYTKHLVLKTRTFSLGSWMHFLPFVLYQAFNITCLVAFRDNRLMFFPLEKERELSGGFVLVNWAIILQASIYMARSIILLKGYARKIKNVFSSIDKITLNWLRNITYLVVAVLFIFIVENVLDIMDVHISYHFNLSSVLVAVYVYAIGYMGLFQSEVLVSPKITEPMELLSVAASPIPVDRQPQGAPVKPEKYEKSGLAEEKAMMYLDGLLKLISEKKPFTNPDLTLNQLADMVSISPHNLSEVLNTQLKQNFFDFINKYRIEKVKNDLSDPGKKNIKLLSIAFDAGFNSKSSFNSLFKKYTGQTPSEYRQKNCPSAS